MHTSYCCFYSYIPTSNYYTPAAPWVSDMAGSDTCFTGSCHCDCDCTGSCAVEEDEAEETGKKEWSFHKLVSEEYSREQFLKGVQFLCSFCGSCKHV